MPERTRITVLKLGGAQARSGHLHDWLQAIDRNVGRIVVVAGGGPFADVVRSTQPEIGFDDAAAHEMALNAMGQFARAITGVMPRFRLADSMHEMHDLLARELTPVWSPAPMVLEAGLPATWSITSDSLSAWLAGRLHAERLILVKYGGRGVSADNLSNLGIVDPAFPDFFRGASTPTFLASPDESELLALGLDGKAFAEIPIHS